MIASEAEKKNLKRVDKQPKTINVPNPVMAEWNSKETLQEWRKNWADICNQYLEKNHIDARIDHRSYAEQGVNRVGTIHMGVQAWQMEKQGIETVWKVCVHGRLLVLIRESYTLQNLLGKKNPTGHRWNLQRL